MERRLLMSITDVPEGEERDFVDVLETVASQIEEAVEYGDSLSGSASAGDVTAQWKIVRVA